MAATSPQASSTPATADYPATYATSLKPADAAPDSAPGLWRALLGIALITAGLAGWQWHDATIARQQALSRQLAAESESLSRANPDVASLLAIYAYRTYPTVEATTSLGTAAATPLLHTLTAHTSEVYGVAFSPNGRTLATTSGDHTARLWDVATGHPLHTLTAHTSGVYGVAFSPNGRTLATTSGDGTARLWDVATGHPLHTLTAHTSGVYGVAFSPNGRTLATTSGDGTARLWDVATGHPLHTLTGHTDTVNSVVFSPNGRTLATASIDGTARLWDVATGHPCTPSPTTPTR